MKKIILFFVYVIFAVSAWAQTRAPVPFEKKHEIYFEDMTLDEFIESTWDPRWTNVIKQERFSATRALMEQTELTYNPSNAITTKISKNSESQLISRVVYSYNGRGLLETEALRDRKNKPVSTFRYTYNDRGHMVERLMLSGADRLLAKTTFEVDTQGRVNRSTTRDSSDAVISSTAFTYDAQGNVTKQEVSNAARELISIINSVWQGGKKIEDTRDSSGNLLHRVTRTFGQSGELLEEVVENFQGESKQILKYEYEYRDVRS